MTNPFRPNTNIRFDVRKQDTATLTIFNVKGQIVEKVEFEPGYHTHEWDASRYSSGVYFYKLRSDGYLEVKKMILLK